MKILKYICFNIIRILSFFLLYLFIGSLLLSSLLILTAYLTTFSKFFILYFIPIYFILSLYSINYSGYYKFKFFGYDVKLLNNYIYNIIIFLINIVYNYKYINIILFGIVLIFSFNYEKIYFFFIISIISFFVILYYLYNNSYKLKIYLEKYFLYFNLSIIIGVIYLFKNDNIDFNTNWMDNFNYPDFILRVASPRWLFKNSYDFLFPEYKKEIKILNDGLNFNDLYLKDKYFSKFRNTNFNLDFILIKKSIEKNFDLYKIFIKNSDLSIINYFKNIYIMDEFNKLNKLSREKINYQQKLYDKSVFDLNLNKAYNCINLDENSNKKILLKYKNIYVRSFLKELGLSKNLLVNTNLVNHKYNLYINNFYKFNKMSSILDKSIDSYLDNLQKQQNNFIFNHLKNKYNDYFLRLKLHTLNFYNSIDLLDNYLKNLNFNEFKNEIMSDTAKNKYDIYSDSSIYKPEFFLGNKYIIDKNIRELDIELYIKYLNKYYKYFNNNSHIINWLNDLFILIFDNKKIKYEYWSDSMSLKDIEEKDAFNLYRNFNTNVLYTYKKNFNIFSYHEFKRDGTHYETTNLPNGVARSVLLNKDVKHFYYRFFNYNKNLEAFMNSYLWLSFEDSNIRLESYESLVEYNKHLNKYKSLLDNYIKKHETDPKLNIDKLNDYVNNDLKKLLELQYKERGNKEIEIEIRKVLKIKRILRLDYFIKNVILNDDILSNYFLKENEKYYFFSSYKKKEVNYIVLNRYLNNNEYFNIFEYMNILKNNRNDSLKLFDSYKDHIKDHIFVGLYYDFIGDNKQLFKVNKNFDYLPFFFNYETDVYMSEGALLNKMLIDNLSYFKNYLDNSNKLYTEVGADLTTLCDSIYKESDNTVLRLQNMLRILYDIIENKSSYKESIIVEKLNQVTNEYSFFKEIFSNFNKAIRAINRFNENVTPNLNEFNKLNKREMHPEVIFFNYESLLKYILEKNIDIKDFQESSKMLKEILDEYDEIINKLNSWEDLLERKYIYVDHDPFYNEMQRCHNEINKNFSNRKESTTLGEQIKRLDRIILNNNNSLNEGQDYVIKSINRLKIIQTRANTDFIKDLKKVNDIISKK